MRVNNEFNAGIAEVVMKVLVACEFSGVCFFGMMLGLVTCCGQHYQGGGSPLAPGYVTLGFDGWQSAIYGGGMRFGGRIFCKTPPYPRIAVESPIMHRYARAIVGNYDQII